jgi:hypothetical protein
VGVDLTQGEHCRPRARHFAGAGHGLAGVGPAEHLVVVVAGCIALVRDQEWWQTVVAAPLFLLGAVLTLSIATALRESSAVSAVVGVAIGALIALAAALGVLVIAVATEALRPLLAATIALIGLATTAVTVAIFYAWASELLGYRVAGLSTVAAGVLALAGAVTLMTRAPIERIAPVRWQPS